MTRRGLIALFISSMNVWASTGYTQPSGRRSQIGVLHVVPAAESPGFTAFRQRLSDLGYAQDRKIEIEYRWSDQPDRLATLAVELTTLNPELIVTADSRTTIAARKATRQLPIVAAVLTEDPVAAGLVNSLGRPGGNVTGISALAPEMSGKRLELLQEMVPGLKRVAVLWSRNVPYHVVLLRESNQAASSLGLDLVLVEAKGTEDIDAAFETVIRERADAVDVLGAAQFARIRKQIAELGLKHRLPIVAGVNGFVQLGGLIKYGPSTSDSWRQAAVYVDKILKGAKPADLPVQQNDKVELLINLKTAKALGLSVPSSLLVRADEVVD